MIKMFLPGLVSSQKSSHVKQVYYLLYPFPPQVLQFLGKHLVSNVGYKYVIAARVRLDVMRRELPWHGH